MGIIVALIALSVLIIIHELGHFLVAKAVGIRVLEFSLFMGPKLFSFTKGETIYSLRLIPMGGYVKMEGEEESSKDPRAFSNQSVGKRALVIAAGPAMNILAAFIFSIIFLANTGFYTNTITEFYEDSVIQKAGAEIGDRFISYDGKRLYEPASDINLFMYGEDGSDSELVYYDVSEDKMVKKIITPGKTATRVRLGFSAQVEGNTGSNVIDIIETDSPLMKAGIKRGDRIIKLDDTEVFTTPDIQNYLNTTRTDKSAPLTITIERNGKMLTFENIKPFSDFNYTLAVNLEYKEGNIFEIVGASAKYCLSTARNVLMTIKWLFNGTISVKELSGPVGIIGTVGSVVETQQTFGQILLNLIYISSFISINLGIMNLIPFPALDGSMLVILLIEKIRGKPIPQEKVGMISFIGFILLMGVLVITLFNDIPRWLL
ncbi:MAG: RIP metalloprotease RseP [Clostridiaceae bacterium]|jgi:regulator of sigma E protease|nr:RIP metalloprotease RseP [Clostridiaceae bacterium]